MIKWCKSCVLPNTRPNIIIDKDGVCNACNFHRKIKNKINWSYRKNKFKILCKTIKKKNKSNYDCIVPVSGGKDSFWQIKKCIEFNLVPLAVTWKTPARTEIGEKNIKALVKLGVDHIEWQINPIHEKKMLYKFFHKYGSTAILMHNAIHSIPTKIANKFGIKYIFWGENSAEEYGYTNKKNLGKQMSKSWIKEYGNIFSNNNLFRKKDLKKNLGYNYFNKKNNFKSIFLGYFFNWDPKITYKNAKDSGFKSLKSGPKTGIYNFADIDDDFISIHHWLKWYKFGFTRVFDNLSIEIRNKRITRKEAIEIIRQNRTNPPLNDIKKFCRYINISIKEFYKITEKFRNKKIWKKDKNKWYIKNFLIKNYRW